MSKRAGNLERVTPQERQWLRVRQAEDFLIAEGELCPFCRDMDCDGRGVKEDCAQWPACAAKMALTPA